MFSGLPSACRDWDLPLLSSLWSEARAAPRVLCGLPRCPQQGLGNEGERVSMFTGPFSCPTHPVPESSSSSASLVICAMSTEGKLLES